MNFDLMFVLLLLSGVGIFLAVVVGRLQLEQYEELERDLENQYKVIKDLEEGYRSLSETAANPDSLEILPMFTDRSGKLRIDRRANYLLTGRIAKRVLVLVEAIEHIDSDADFSRTCLEHALHEFGTSLEDSGSLEDLKTMLRLARLCIHSRLSGTDDERFRARIIEMRDQGNLPLSLSGQLRMREFLSIMYKPDMKPLRDDYLHLFPAIEEIMLAESNIQERA